MLKTQISKLETFFPLHLFLFPLTLLLVHQLVFPVYMAGKSVQFLLFVDLQQSAQFLRLDAQRQKLRVRIVFFYRTLRYTVLRQIQVFCRIRKLLLTLRSQILRVRVLRIRLYLLFFVYLND